MGYLIRNAKTSDVYCGLLEALFSLSDDYIDPYKAAQVILQLTLSGHLYHIVCECDETHTVIGTGSLIIQQKIIHNCGIVGQIEDVAVNKDHQGKGVGRQIVLDLIHEAKKRGCYKVILGCNETNVEFYKKLGFKKHENLMRIDL